MTDDNPKTENKDDSEMTPEERLAWLRERGVLIETAEERRAAAVSSALQAAEALEQPTDNNNDSQTTISYVLVPADTSRPLVEKTLQVSSSQKTKGQDLLVEHLKSEFATTDPSSTVDISLLREQAQDTLLSTSTSENGAASSPLVVSDEALKNVVKQQASVETFTLVHAMPSNQFTSIVLYLDEVGMLKRLPLNTRAAEYAQRAGFHPPPTFYGNVFLGRVKHRQKTGGGGLMQENVSLVLGMDTALDSAPWLQTAMTENLEYQMQMNQLTGRPTTTTQPAVAGSDGKSKQEEGFTWTQTEQELELQLPLPAANVKPKQVQVKFRPQSVQVDFKSSATTNSKPIVLLPTMKLFERIDVDVATWTIDKSSSSGGDDDSNTNKPLLVLTMEKVEEALWPRIRD